MRLLISILVGSAILVNLQKIKCDYALDSLNYINMNQDALTANFVESIGEVFYEPQQVAKQHANYPLLAISAQMAEAEVISYAVQTRALYIAQDMIARYFVARVKPLSMDLVEGRPLIDLLIQCVTDHSIANALESIVLHRKKIYLQLLAYEHVSGVRELAVRYSSRVAQLRARRAAAEVEFDKLLNLYADPYILSPQRKMLLLREIDQIINEAITLSNMIAGNKDTKAGMPIIAMVEKYVHPKILDDIRSAKLLAVGQVKNHDLNLIQSVNLDDVTAYEDRLLYGADGIASISSEIGIELTHLTDQYDEVLQEIFYEPQKVAEKEGNFHLSMISAQMAEVATLLYADERRMYFIVRHLIEQLHYNAINRILIVNRKPIDILVRGLIKYAVEHGLRTINWRLKRLYLISKRYVAKDVHIRRLCREFYRRINAIREKVHRTEADILELTNKYRADATATIAQQVLLSVERHMSEGIRMWQDGPSDNMRHVQRHINRQPFGEILTAKNKARNRVYRPSTADIAAVGDAEASLYEQQLLAIED